ncbi:MAG: Uma2 family endonuclease [Lachnospiraceae bacterium]|nr:Uma2 family endonuclease [Lachnospiraceae bacterium]
MTIQDMKERKKELGYTYAQIASLSGVPLGTVQKIFNGATTSPRYETLQALSKVLAKPQVSYHSQPQTDPVREALSVYTTKRQGDYTLEDYYEIPDDVRMELIDGTLYDMSSPTSAHQLITGFLYTKLLNHVFSSGGTCLPMVSPMDVQLDCDDKTMVEPDVMVVCDRDKIIQRCVYGAPDFIIEVLSPATRRKDTVIKLGKYSNAGVREYWTIDPIKKKVVVYDFEHDDYPILYGFDAKVPVRIWDGSCEIDFAELYEHIRFLYERD